MKKASRVVLTLLALATSGVVVVYITTQYRSTVQERYRGPAIVSGQIVWIPISVPSRELERIDEVTMTCGCMRLLDDAKRDVVFPHQLGEGDSARFLIEIATIGKVGLSPYSILFGGSKHQKAKTLKKEIELSILPGWYVIPDVLRRDQCRIGDTFADKVHVYKPTLAKELRVEEILSSNQADVHWEPTKIAVGTENLEHPTPIPPSGFEFAGTLSFSYSVGEYTRNESVTIVGGNGEVRKPISLITTIEVSLLSVRPKQIRWSTDRHAGSRVVWLEHATGVIPEVLCSDKDLNVELGEPNAEADGREVRKVIVRRVSLTNPDSLGTETIEFRTGKHSSMLSILP